MPDGVIEAGRVPLTAPLVGAIDAARRGEAAGWNVLFDRYYATVVRYAMARLGDPHGAEDVAQEVFVAAVEAVVRLRDTSERGIEAWLLGITRYKVADRIRRRRRERREPASVAVAADAGEVAMDRLTAAEVRESMRHLSDEQRDVVIRRFVLDQSLEQVAQATGRPVGAVKSMQHRALAALARLCARGAR